MSLEPKKTYFARDPNGREVIIPKEVFQAVCEFVGARSCEGSLTLQYQGGEITQIESIAKRPVAKL